MFLQKWTLLQLFIIRCWVEIDIRVSEPMNIEREPCYASLSIFSLPVMPESECPGTNKTVTGRLAAMFRSVS